LHSDIASCLFSNSSINLSDDIVFSLCSLCKFDVIWGHWLTMSTPGGIEFDEDDWVLLNKTSVVGVIKDYNFTVSEDE
jgi:hypothetical protein